MNADLPEKPLPTHHNKLDYCFSRKAYRNGRRKTAVKVFTINIESKFLIVTNVNATGLADDLLKAYAKHGTVVRFEELLDYQREPFTQVFLLKYDDIQSARKAKRITDEMYFYGSTLHVFYAPEYETVSDTREKLMDRRCNVIQRVKYLEREAKRSRKGAKTEYDGKSSSVKAAGLSGASGAYASLASTSMQNDISPSLPCKREFSSLKMPSDCDHSTSATANANVQVTTNTSKLSREQWMPPRKKPKLVRLPGYVPPKMVSIPTSN